MVLQHVLILTLLCLQATMVAGPGLCAVTVTCSVGHAVVQDCALLVW